MSIDHPRTDASLSAHALSAAPHHSVTASTQHALAATTCRGLGIAASPARPSSPRRTALSFSAVPPPRIDAASPAAFRAAVVGLRAPDAVGSAEPAPARPAPAESAPTLPARIRPSASAPHPPRPRAASPAPAHPSASVPPVPANPPAPTPPAPARPPASTPPVPAPPTPAFPFVFEYPAAHGYPYDPAHSTAIELEAIDPATTVELSTEMIAALIAEADADLDDAPALVPALHTTPSRRIAALVTAPGVTAPAVDSTTLVWTERPSSPAPARPRLFPPPWCRLRPPRRGLVIGLLIASLLCLLFAPICWGVASAELGGIRHGLVESRHRGLLVLARLWGVIATGVLIAIAVYTLASGTPTL